MIIVGMSGGVDSSVTASYLKSKGNEILGITMKLIHDSNQKVSCNGKVYCGDKDTMDAVTVAQRMDFLHFTVNYENEFKKEVIDNFIESYKNCLTPNPCIKCNEKIKFDLLLKKGIELGGEYLATGHYARIDKKNGRYRLLKAKYLPKDQTYFLYKINQDQLSRTLFPMGEYTKEEVRKMALGFNLINANKSESMDICFVKNGTYKDFLKDNGVNFKNGIIVNEEGEKIGEHCGIEFYTIGQKVGISDKNGSLYVKEINGNTIVASYNSGLFSKEIKIKNINWISGEKPKNSFKADVKIRYSINIFKGTIFPDGRIILDERQRAITPGQSAVFYIEDECIGGGEIL